MLYLKNGEWNFCPYFIKYKQHGKIIEQFVEDKKWWEDFASKWDHTEILELSETEYTAEQYARLEEVKDTAEGFEYYAGRYALDGVFPNELEKEERLENHPFKMLQLAKENKDLGQLATDLDIRLMMQELK